MSGGVVYVVTPVELWCGRGLLKGRFLFWGLVFDTGARSFCCLDCYTGAVEDCVCGPRPEGAWPGEEDHDAPPPAPGPEDKEAGCFSSLLLLFQGTHTQPVPGYGATGGNGQPDGNQPAGADAPPPPQGRCTYIRTLCIKEQEQEQLIRRERKEQEHQMLVAFQQAGYLCCPQTELGPDGEPLARRDLIRLGVSAAELCPDWWDSVPTGSRAWRRLSARHAGTRRRPSKSHVALELGLANRIDLDQDNDNAPEDEEDEA